MTILFETRPGVKLLITDEVNKNLELVWITNLEQNFTGNIEQLHHRSYFQAHQVLISYKQSSGNGMYRYAYKDYNDTHPDSCTTHIKFCLSSIIRFLDLEHIPNLNWYMLHYDPKEYLDDWQPKAPRNPSH